MSVHERPVGKGKNSVVPQRCLAASSAGDRTQSLQMLQPRTQMIHFTKSVHLHEVMEQQDGRLGLLVFGSFLAACALHRFLGPTSRFDYGNQNPTSEGAGRCFLIARHGRRILGPRKGGNKCDISHCRVHFRRCSPHHY